MPVAVYHLQRRDPAKHSRIFSPLQREFLSPLFDQPEGLLRADVVPQSMRSRLNFSFSGRRRTKIAET